MFFGFTFNAETIVFTNCDSSRALQYFSLGILSVRTGSTLDLAANTCGALYIVNIRLINSQVRNNCS